MNFKAKIVSPDNLDFQEFWKQAWDEICDINPHLDKTEMMKFGGNAAIAMLFYEDDTPVAINSYLILGETVARSCITYVAPNFRRKGISKNAWAYAHEKLKEMGIKGIIRPVTANPSAGKLACEAAGFDIANTVTDKDGQIIGYNMAKVL